MRAMVRKPTKVNVFYHDGTKETAERIHNYLKARSALAVLSTHSRIISIHLLDTVLYINPGKYLVVDESGDYSVYDHDRLAVLFEEVPMQEKAA